MKTLFRFKAAATICVVGAFFSAVASGQAPPALPGGNTGIAASYPNDVGVSAHPNVLFADGFEGYSSAGQLVSSGNYDNYYQSSNIAFETTCSSYSEC